VSINLMNKKATLVSEMSQSSMKLMWIEWYLSAVASLSWSNPKGYGWHPGGWGAPYGVGQIPGPPPCLVVTWPFFFQLMNGKKNSRNWEHQVKSYKETYIWYDSHMISCRFPIPLKPI
jgi:hypothetical protein